MRRLPWTTYVWPGLPQVWAYGDWSALALALGAAGVFDVLLLVTCGWSELIGPSWRIALWSAFAVAWVAAVGWSVGQYRQTASAIEHFENDPFGEALTHYLAGDYFQTEQVLQAMLRRNDHDADARLLLATTLRRDKRLEEAERQLNLLAKMENAARWESEIQDERDLLRDLSAEAKAERKNVAAA
jgi:hypothetical protein